MNTNVRLFDANDRLVSNFDEEIEKILISIHGDSYYDIDEELINTNFVPTNEVIDSEIYKDEELERTMELVDSLMSVDAREIKIVEEEIVKIKFKDFVPVLFFILIFAIIVIAGWYFLNTVDLTNILDKLS